MDALPARFALAKLNLCLHVLGQRADGYHRLESLAAFVEQGDRLAFAPSDRLTLERTGPEATGLPPVEQDLVMRAARALAGAAGIEPRAAIRLEKRLPIGAGLGGGSSDAAATLKGLSLLWQLDPARIDLSALALSLGADVPVCLAGRAAIMRGIGEELTPVPPLPAVPILLVNPRVAVPTADVFRRYALGARLADERQLPGLDTPVRDAADLARRLKGSGNDLTAAAVAIAPVIAEVLAALENLGGCLLARMSGSGATCFALFADERARDAAAAALTRLHPDWWVVPTRFRSDAGK